MNNVRINANKFGQALADNLDVEALDASVNLSKLWIDLTFEMAQTDNSNFTYSPGTVDMFIECAQFWTNVSKQLLNDIDALNPIDGGDHTFVNCDRFVAY